MSGILQRKKLRLPGYDYSQKGGYFVTFSTKNRENLLASIHVGRDDLGAPCPVAPTVCLTRYGACVEKYICSIPFAYPDVTLHKYLIMPNHVHLLLSVETKEVGAPGSSRPTQLIPRIVSALKRFVNRDAGQNLWQTSYYDHIIRDDADYLRIWKYIDENPAKWGEDEYYNCS